MKSILIRLAGFGALVVALGLAGCGLLGPDDQYALLRERFGADLIAKIESGKIRLEGGDGLSVQTAVKIVGAATEQENTAAEHFFLSKMFGREGFEWAPTGQSPLTHAGRSYDVLRIALAGEKARRDYYFDVTESRQN
jgi:hypothetical protein